MALEFEHANHRSDSNMAFGGTVLYFRHMLELSHVCRNVQGRGDSYFWYSPVLTFPKCPRPSTLTHLKFFMFIVDDIVDGIGLGLEAQQARRVRNDW